MLVTVRYKEEEVSLDMRKGQTFDDFLSWAFFRFQLSSSSSLFFSHSRDEDEKEVREVIPSYSLIESLPMKKRILYIHKRERSQNKKKNEENNSSASSPYNLKQWYPLVAVVILCIMLQTSITCADTAPNALRSAVDTYNSIFNFFFKVKFPDKVAVDALTTLVAYPVTTFYIRRVLNPDTGGVQASFDKYGSDVLFAALSSAVLTHIKYILKNCLLAE